MSAAHQLAAHEPLSPNVLPSHACVLCARDRAPSATARAGASTSARQTNDYPAAVVRIVRGHTVVTVNPATILVSVSDAFRVGLGMVSIANRMRPLSGTHGALGASN